MTQLDVLYRFDGVPSEASMMALGRVREVYGVRSVRVDEAEKTVRVEYDATRLSEAAIHQFMRRSGINVVERVALSQPAPPPPPPPAPAA